jgi:hypothetical protein
MAFVIHSSRRPDLPQVVEVLQQLENDPQLLARDRDQRFDEPPPPYSESGESTQIPTPRTPVVDESYEREKRRSARYQYTPLNQFKNQARQERERLEHQLSNERFGRKQTLPWDGPSDLRANSENNDRSRWVEQGIWGDNWGPAWPKNSHPMSTWARPDGPFVGGTTLPRLTSGPALAGAMRSPTRSRNRNQHRIHQGENQRRSKASDLAIFGPAVGQPKWPKSPRPIKIIQTMFGSTPVYPIPVPTVPNPEASRLYHQFLYQISKEREWIRDEANYERSGSAIDFDAAAYRAVKNHWIKDEIWNPTWGELPGMTWIHEEPDPEEEVLEGPAASDEPGRRPSNGDDGRQLAQPSRTAPVPEVADVPTEHNNPFPPGRPKRSRRSDADEDEQPPKRRKNNTRRAARASGDASDAVHANKEPHNPRTAITKGAEASFDEHGVPTSRGVRAKRGTSVSTPPRRSARIAAKEAKQTAGVATELQGTLPRSAPTRNTRRPRAARGSQDDTTAATKTTRRDRAALNDQGGTAARNSDVKRPSRNARRKARK